MLISKDILLSYTDAFNRCDEENVTQHIANKDAPQWMLNNTPLLECPDKAIEETYYFRWWTFRKHIKKTPDGFVITEFHPDVPWAGKYNTIVAAAGHHMYEGRWLADESYIRDYIRFWFTDGAARRSYSSWLGDSILQFCLVRGDFSTMVELLPRFVDDYEQWERSNRHASGLFWSCDDRDGSEFSISGSGLRPTLNSYMHAYAAAIARAAGLAGQAETQRRFSQKAADIKALIERHLWNAKTDFFQVIPADSAGQDVSLSFDDVGPERNVRELNGYIPWYFNIPDAGYEAAWKQLLEDRGFRAPFGPTTAEQRHPRFMEKHAHECLWNGPSWPYATSQTLIALANLLNHYEQPYVTRADYVSLLHNYALSHRRAKAGGDQVNWIDENLDPYTGEWIARSILEAAGWPAAVGGYERGKDYNHSTFCDLVITGLAGIRPSGDNILRIHPLFEGWAYFCVENIRYHGKDIAIVYDRDGTKYGKGRGLSVYVSGKRAAGCESLRAIDVPLC